MAATKFSLAVILLVFAISLALLFTRSFFRNRYPASPTSPPGPSLGYNPFGLMIGVKEKSLVEKMEVVKALKAAYYRPPAIFLDRWNGVCQECETALENGLKLVLTIRANGTVRQPTTPPSDYNLYQKQLAEVIELYRPEVLVVENEENSKLFYAGTPLQYLEELRVACQVAHAQGIKCTNGGLVSSLVTLLTAEHYREQGRENKAEDYLKRAFSPEKYQQYLGNVAKPLAQEQKEKGKQLIAGYRKAGVDYVNFHWYNADPEALEETVTYLQDTSGLPALTNEVGQQENEDPAQVTAIMAKIVELRLPIAIWFSLDIEGMGGARGLTDESGNLRPNGQAFKNLIEGMNKQGYSCPKKTWVNCMPGPEPSKPECSPEYLTWAQKNCPNFQGPVY